jgi:hypothetical protein
MIFDVRDYFNEYGDFPAVATPNSARAGPPRASNSLQRTGVELRIGIRASMQR